MAGLATTPVDERGGWLDEHVLLLRDPGPGSAWRAGDLSWVWTEEPWAPPADLARTVARWQREKAAQSPPPVALPRDPVRVAAACAGAAGLELSLQPVSYDVVYAFGGNIRRPDASGASPWDRCWRGDWFACPFPNSLDLHVVLRLGDGTVPLCDRGGAVLFPGRWGVTAPVGLNRTVDRAAPTGPPLVSKAVARAVQSEVGLVADPVRMRFLGLSAETRSGVVSLAVLVDVDTSATRFLSLNPPTERRRFEPVPFDGLAAAAASLDLTPLSRSALWLTCRWWQAERDGAVE